MEGVGCSACDRVALALAAKVEARHATVYGRPGRPVFARSLIQAPRDPNDCYVIEHLAWVFTMPRAGCGDLQTGSFRPVERRRCPRLCRRQTARMLDRKQLGASSGSSVLANPFACVLEARVSGRAGGPGRAPGDRRRRAFRRQAPKVRFFGPSSRTSVGFEAWGAQAAALAITLRSL